MAEWEIDSRAGQEWEAKSFLTTFLLLLVNLMPGCGNNWLKNSVLCSSFVSAQFSLTAIKKKNETWNENIY